MKIQVQPANCKETIAKTIEKLENVSKQDVEQFIENYEEVTNIGQWTEENSNFFLNKLSQEKLN
ncbi:hypothetical protein M153_15200015038 [Pseudoloma neurophilia]|uniref:Uncharacterized protein n=1 Tax=Pseudoloma neurophilia TaxID=146866 RepID=A0A0R0M6R6_9MICR|nr:hypothetical protein M153_15200015038 [Pseudoloma neurophilia]